MNYPTCGFYWVCQKNCTPEIAYCWGKYWTVTGNDHPFSITAFEFIDPVRIENPTFDRLRHFPADQLLKIT
jgi:hypothetical protein